MQTKSTSKIILKLECYCHPERLKHRKDPCSQCLKGLFWIISYIFLLIGLLRRHLYAKHLFRSMRLPIPVLSVGNIVAGGTGKTPLCIFLAQALERHFQVAILTRGYRSSNEHAKYPVQITLQDLGKIDPLYVGDEAYLMAKHASQATIFISKYRIASAQVAVQQGYDCIILDDGLQHLNIHRDYDIVVLDAKNPFGSGYCLPYGLLREPPFVLKTASLIVLNHVDQVLDKHSIKNQIRQHSQAPIIETQMTIEGIYTRQGKYCDISTHSGIALFCGIGQPLSFKQSLENLGYRVVDLLCLQDHVAPSLEALRQFCAQAKQKGACCLVCTEKDEIKLPQDLEIELPMCWAKAQLKITDGSAEWNHFIANIISKRASNETFI